MDPNANLLEQLRLARSIQRCSDYSQEIDTGDAARLCELVLALDEWISKGGFYPQKWSRA